MYTKSVKLRFHRRSNRPARQMPRDAARRGVVSEASAGSASEAFVRFSAVDAAGLGLGAGDVGQRRGGRARALARHAQIVERCERRRRVVLDDLALAHIRGVRGVGAVKESARETPLDDLALAHVFVVVIVQRIRSSREPHCGCVMRNACLPPLDDSGPVSWAALARGPSLMKPFALSRSSSG